MAPFCILFANSFQYASSRFLPPRFRLTLPAQQARQRYSALLCLPNKPDSVTRRCSAAWMAVRARALAAALRSMRYAAKRRVLNERCAAHSGVQTKGALSRRGPGTYPGLLPSKIGSDRRKHHRRRRCCVAVDQRPRRVLAQLNGEVEGCHVLIQDRMQRRQVDVELTESLLTLPLADAEFQGKPH